MQEEWLNRFSTSLAQEIPAFPPGLAVSTDLTEKLLSLARIVADGTGQRTNAPLTAYMVGYLACSVAGEGETPEAAVARATEIAQRLLTAGK